MRTLKKALCLVLVLSMVMGIGVIGAGAAYSDADQIEYQEAVDVMTAIGVMQGVGENTFDPDGTFTRAQAAKMLSYMILGETAAEALPTRSDFTDVSADQWFSKYIGFGVQEGYLAGMGDGTFKPDDPVTGYQWAKMLLCALGYDPKTEGLEGNGYEINVAKLALTNKKLFTGNEGADYNQNATREEAALYAFNMIQQVPVEYPGTTTVIINGVKVTIAAGKAEDIASGDMFYEIHFADLEKNTSVSNDAFGRPAVRWDYDNKEVGTYADTPDLTYTTAVTGGKLYTDLGRVSPASLTIIRNGVTAGDPSAELAKIASGNTSTFDRSGNGILLEVYYNKDTKAATVIEISQAVGKIVDFTEADVNDDGEVLDEAYVTVEIVAGVSNTGSTLTFDTTAYNEADAENETYVVFTFTGSGSAATAGTIQSLSTATLTTVVPTRINANGSIVANGQTYNIAKRISGQASVDAGAVTEKEEVVLYLDTYGYVLHTSKPAGDDTTNYAYVVNAVANGGSVWENQPMAQLLLANGETVTVSTAADYGTLKGHIVTYTVKSDEYTLTDGSDGTAANDTTALNIDRGVANGTVDSKSIYFSDKTVFFVVTKDSNDKDVYSVYTGINAVPSLEGTSNAYSFAMTKTAATSAGSIADAVLVEYAKESTSSTDTNTYFILGDADVKPITDVDLGTYYEYNAVVNGEITTVMVDAPLSDVKFVKSVTMNDKGIITAYGDNVDTKTATGTVKAENSLVGFGTTGAITYETYTADCAVYMIEDGKITASSVGAIKTDANDGVVYTVNDNNVVNAIYVTVND